MHHGSLEASTLSGALTGDSFFLHQHISARASFCFELFLMLTSNMFFVEKKTLSNGNLSDQTAKK